MMPESWIEALDTWASTAPHKTAFLYLRDGEEEAARLTWIDLQQRVRRTASAIRRLKLNDTRVLLLQPPGLEFVTTFLGCLMGGAVPVPIYPPNFTREDSSLTRFFNVTADCRPAGALIADAQAAKVADAGAKWPSLRDLTWITSESLAAANADDPSAEMDWALPGADDLAFLQYTSGSTAAPKGVRVTHGNIAHNARRITASYGMQLFQKSASWLPPYHDMGLIGYVLQPVFIGAETALMSPFAFLQRPMRWLETISRHRAAISFAPNFAYELVLRKVRPEHLLRLDLSCWTIAGNGAEPVRIETMNRFAKTFEVCGFRRDAFCPSYGLAECTLLASSERGIRPLAVDADRLEQNVVQPSDSAAAAARVLASVGRPVDGMTIEIVDPATLKPAASGEIGEIWLSGPSVADGYFERAEETDATFRLRLHDGRGPFLRTGDLGFFHDGRLYVTGRLKDLIIIDGRNHYPQDIEHTVEASHPAIRPAGVVAFSVDREGEEQLVVAAEKDRAFGGTDDPAETALAEAARSLRRAVAERHDLHLRSVVWLPPGKLLKTGSGKPQRRACRMAYLNGSLGGVEVRQ